MSRIGKSPIHIPEKVDLVIKDSCLVFSNTKHNVELETHGRVNISYENNTLSFSPKGTSKSDRAFWGTYRSLSNNIIIGLIEGYKKVLNINGVGYRAAISGKTLKLQLGYSHPVDYELPEHIDAEVDKNNNITISGINKQLVGEVAAKIRSFRPPEPYKGKGIKYADEVIIRKAGKTAKK